MCGIVNFKEKEDHESILKPMLRIMHHRGPDATGIYTSDEVGRGHARLSIIDLSGGEESLKQAGCFDLSKVQRLVSKCRQQDGQLVSEKENMAMVAILSTQLLDHQFIHKFPADSGAALHHTVVERQDS